MRFSQQPIGSPSTELIKASQFVAGEFSENDNQMNTFINLVDRSVVMIIKTDLMSNQDLTYTISEAVAEQTDSDICELPPLYETIDPDALDAFLQYSDSTDAHPDLSVEFSYCGCRVTIDSIGQIQLNPEAESRSSIPSS